MKNLIRGDRAPEFETVDINGNNIQLDGNRGKNTLICFFRFASCPLCTVRFTQLLQKFSEYRDKDLNIIAVFESSPEYIKTYLNEAKKIPFPIVADLDGRLFKLYNVKKSFLAMMLGMFRMKTMFKGMRSPGYSMGKPDGSVSRVPADFLIDSLMTIEESYYGSDIGDHIPFKRIDAFLAK